MSIGQDLKSVFNWMAGKPHSQYTLGGKYSLPFNRTARFAERITTIPAMAAGAGIALLGIPTMLVGSVPAGLGVLAVAALAVSFGKVSGLAHGGVAQLVTMGAAGLMNRLVKTPAPKAPA